MKQLGHHTRFRGSPAIRRATGVLMGAAAVGLVLATVLGAPLVSILLVGLLLLCPLLMWVPFRYEDRALDEPRRTERRDR